MSSPTPVVPLTPEEERTWATLIPIGGLVGVFVLAGALGWLAPLLGYLLLGPRSAFVREASRNALNFQLTMLIASVISAVLSLVLIGFLLLIAIAVIVIVFSIIGAVRGSRGEPYVYPLTFNLVK